MIMRRKSEKPLSYGPIDGWCRNRADWEVSMMWVGFNLAAEIVERELGLSWGAAQRTLIDACENQELRTNGKSVLFEDLTAWLKAKRTKPKGGKRPRIIRQLEVMYPKGVPDPACAPRYQLKADLLKRDRGLAPLDEHTLKSAIEAYNADPKRS
jgi:hypothetical protein